MTTKSGTSPDMRTSRAALMGTLSPKTLRMMRQQQKTGEHGPEPAPAQTSKASLRLLTRSPPTGGGGRAGMGAIVEEEGVVEPEKGHHRRRTGGSLTSPLAMGSAAPVGAEPPAPPPRKMTALVRRRGPCLCLSRAANVYRDSRLRRRTPIGVCASYLKPRPDPSHPSRLACCAYVQEKLRAASSAKKDSN